MAFPARCPVLDYGAFADASALMSLGAVAAFLWMRPRMGHVDPLPVEPAPATEDEGTQAAQT